MAKEYKRVDEWWGDLETFVKEMQEYWKRGELIEAEFNGRIFHSDTITMDSAYLEVTGYTKEDYERACDEEMRMREERAAAERAQRMESLPAKGREILDEQYWEKWDQTVKDRVNGIYNGLDLDCCLEIVDALNKGKTVEEVEAILDAQDHSGASYGLVVLEVAGFCNRGLEFAEHVKGQEWVQNYKASRQKEARAKAVAEHQLEDQKRREELYAKGREVLDEKYLGRWDELVDWKMEHSMYQGLDLEIAAKMIDVLNNGGSVADAKAIVDGQSWGSIDMSAPIIAQVTEMCDRGNEFKAYVDHKIVFDEGQKYGHIKNFWCGDLENFVKKMQEFEAKGWHVEADFNGRVFQSDTVTIDSAYLEVTGKTKDEFDRAVEEARQRMREEEEQYKSQLPELKARYIEAGQALIAEDKWSDWEQCVDIRLGDLYKGADLEASLELMKQLSNGVDFADVEETLENQNHSGASYGITMSIVRSFSDRGEDFFDYTRGIKREDRGPVIGE